MAKPNHFRWAYIWIFWYFDVALWSNEKKTRAFSGCAKIVMPLHTAGTENPETPNTSKCLTYPWISLRHPQTPTRHPPDTPQAFPGSRRCQQTTTDTTRHKTKQNRQPHTPKETDKSSLSTSGGVCWSLFSSVSISVGIWGYLNGIHGNWRRSEFSRGLSGFSVPAVWSRNTILAQPWQTRLVFIWP